MKVSMIYMASGFGKRYGTNKLITEFRGEPLYLHGLLSLQKAAKLLEKTEKINCQLILISQYERVLSGSVEQVPEAERFFNEDSDQGITASIKLGTEVAWDNADAYLYFVADQPCMAGETIARFVSEFMKSKKGSAVCVQRDTEAALIYFVDATKKSFLLWKEIRADARSCRNIHRKYG